MENLEESNQRRRSLRVRGGGGEQGGEQGEGERGQGGEERGEGGHGGGEREGGHGGGQRRGGGRQRGAEGAGEQRGAGGGQRGAGGGQRGAGGGQRGAGGGQRGAGGGQRGAGRGQRGAGRQRGAGGGGQIGAGGAGGQRGAGGAGGQRGAGGRGQRGGGVRRRRTIISNEIRGTVIDHVLNHGLSMREAGLRVQPNLSRFTVGAIIRTFRMENRTERQPHSGGKRRVFTPEQETLIVNTVRENNAITLRQIKQKILADNAAFNTIQNVSLSTLDRVLKRNSLAMKQVYRVPFERNTDHVKELRRDFVLVSPIHYTNPGA
ncbi:mesenchyme-specific cell surface glycoprotein-like isoform X1 [Epinephelus moara]|uniref:mesenchyme-specific cell surface glycoprotein-like isoform X1 n=1 Tax=Epinephelus moara TaxID=300413 RepID=UPI00214F443F|nr:mesenchyme-specific cell surface glycoprotein-like isoform X1 [Epinephelus moara]